MKTRATHDLAERAPEREISRPAATLRSPARCRIREITELGETRVDGSPSRGAHARALAVTSIRGTWRSPELTGHPQRREVEAHEAVHRAQFARAPAWPIGSRAQLEREAELGARSLLSGGVFEPTLSAPPTIELAFEPHGGPVLDADKGRKEFWRALAYFQAKDHDRVARRSWERILNQYDPALHERITRHVRDQVRNLPAHQRGELALIVALRLDFDKLSDETKQMLHAGQIDAQERARLPKKRLAGQGKALRARDAQHIKGRNLVEARKLTEPVGGTNGLLNLVVGDEQTNRRTQATLENAMARGGMDEARRTSGRRGALPGIVRLEEAERAIRAEAGRSSAQATATPARPIPPPPSTPTVGALEPTRSPGFFRRALSRCRGIVRSLLRIGGAIATLLDVLDPLIQLALGVELANSAREVGAGRLPKDIEAKLGTLQAATQERLERLQELQRAINGLLIQLPDEPTSEIWSASDRASFAELSDQIWTEYLLFLEHDRRADAQLDQAERRKKATIDALPVALPDLGTALKSQQLVASLQWQQLVTRLQKHRDLRQRTKAAFSRITMTLKIVTDLTSPPTEGSEE